MNSPINPFTRGYHGFDIQRVAVIGYDDRCPMTYLPLHRSQSHVPDEQLIHRRCIFSDDFVLATEGKEVAAELDALCSGTGAILAVLYSIHGDDNGAIRHIGDTPTLEAARDVVQRLSFETGHYSRCWEISSAHVTEDAMRYLEDMADTETPTGLLFVAFHIPCSPAVGVKLIATPWTNANLLQVEGITAEQLRQEHLDQGVPPPLVEVLHQAADADVRILILDADATTLGGLRLYQV
ncbi:TPA: ABC transporter substrate-binding protein [Pseudomonas aeruginosa]